MLFCVVALLSDVYWIYILYSITIEHFLLRVRCIFSARISCMQQQQQQHQHIHGWPHPLSLQKYNYAFKLKSPHREIHWFTDWMQTIYENAHNFLVVVEFFCTLGELFILVKLIHWLCISFSYSYSCSAHKHAFIRFFFAR